MNPRPVMIVEDDPDSRGLLATILTMQGYKVVIARDGAEALTLAREHMPFLILLDLMMPNMSGEDFRRAQLRDPQLSTIPVVLLTAHHQGSVKAQQLGVSYLPKPLALDDVLAQVATYQGSVGV